MRQGNPLRGERGAAARNIPLKTAADRMEPHTEKPRPPQKTPLPLSFSLFLSLSLMQWSGVP
ncbi:MAG: hypothetical protein HC790_08400 [Acaryochloridaceae cyanobacterium CSU_3_4]|nr:hypothetical protein [Acaryochloridaceae cyanobacterium CSU_3_4]